MNFNKSQLHSNTNEQSKNLYFAREIIFNAEKNCSRNFCRLL